MGSSSYCVNEVQPDGRETRHVPYISWKQAKQQTPSTGHS
jgi:hypothetical protein